MNLDILKQKLKTPEDIDEQKAIYTQHNLHYYTPAEEVCNVLTHLIGLIFSIVGLGFMLAKAVSSVQYAVAVLCSLGFIALYGFSSLYHATQNLERKSILRRIDYCSVNLIVIACGTGVALMGGSIVGYAFYGVCFLLVAVSIVLCVVNFAKFRMLSFALNFVIAGLLFSNYFISGIKLSAVSLYCNLAGIVSVLIGAMLFGIKKPFIHAVFHVFVLFGPILFWFATYYMF